MFHSSFVKIIDILIGYATSLHLFAFPTLLFYFSVYLETPAMGGGRQAKFLQIQIIFLHVSNRR